MKIILSILAWASCLNVGNTKLIEILHAVQQRHGWLDRPLLGRLAEDLKLPPSLVYGVASFYHAFSLKPRGQNTYSVCTGTSCHLKGSSRLLRELEKHLNIRSGEGSVANEDNKEMARINGSGQRL
jgi:bidirectional [NiFe] hydrogenase diaphorase subunit